MKRPSGNLDGLLFQGRIVPTELKKDHQNFLAKSYWALKGSVKGFLENKCLCFQYVSNLSNISSQMTKNVISGVLFRVTTFLFRYLWVHFRFKRMISTDSGRLKTLFGKNRFARILIPPNAKPKTNAVSTVITHKSTSATMKPARSSAGLGLV